MVAENLIPAGSAVAVGAGQTVGKLEFQIRSLKQVETPAGKPVLLIVDDNAELLKYLKIILQNEHWEVKTAASAEAAIGFCDQQAITLALVDYMLPDMD